MDSLPQEILSLIYSMLSPRDLINVVLLCNNSLRPDRDARCWQLLDSRNKRHRDALGQRCVLSLWRRYVTRVILYNCQQQQQQWMSLRSPKQEQQIFPSLRAFTAINCDRELVALFLQQGKPNKLERVDVRGSRGAQLFGIPFGDQLVVCRFGYYKERSIYSTSSSEVPEVDSARCRSLECLHAAGLMETSFLERIRGARWPLRELQLPYSFSTTAEPLTTLDVSCLVNLNVRAARHFSDESLRHVGRSCRLLQRINLGCTPISCAALLSFFTEDPPALTHIDVCYVKDVQRVSLESQQALFSAICNFHTPRVLMLGIGGWQHVSNSQLYRFCQENPSLRSIGIGGCHSLTGFGIARLPLTNLVRYNDHEMSASVTAGHREELFRKNPQLQRDPVDEEDWDSLY